MRTRPLFIFPGSDSVLAVTGENIKNARKRRKMSVIQLAQKAAVSRAGLNRLEKGDPGITLGMMFNVLKVLNLQDDIKLIAADDPLGRRIQELDAK